MNVHAPRLRPARLLAPWMLALLAQSAAAQIPPGYYDAADPSSAQSLRSSLHLIIDDHQRYPFTSGGADTWEILELADQDAIATGSVRDIYKNDLFVKQGGGNPLYQREHVWPSSYGFPNDSSSNYPYVDCHSLFICDGLYNGERSNKPFRYCDALCVEKGTAGGGLGLYPGSSNWTSGFQTFGTWEVWNGRKGDVARALFYMDVRYEGGVHGGSFSAEPDLILTDSEALILSSKTGSNESVAYMGMLSVLVEWHQQDPVDARELAHMEAVFSYQGNRNPFVDHPEWAPIVFADPNEGLGDPWINEFHYDNAGLDSGEAVEIAGPAGLDLAGYRILAYNGSSSLEYDSVDLAGVLPDLGGCLGTLSFALLGMQNGPADGLALVDPVDKVIQFLSYEGTLVAGDGPASGLSSQDVGVAETGSSPVDSSLQLAGLGEESADFSWQGPASATFDQVNASQGFGDACSALTPPSAPTGLKAAACADRVELSWNPNTESDLAGYHIWRSNMSGSGYTRLTTTALTLVGFTDSSVSSGAGYYYAATAVDIYNKESVLSAGLFVSVPGGSATSWINELHYDNAGTDLGEFVEVAGVAGTDLAGWSLVAYNGSGGKQYATVPLLGILPDQGSCRGVQAFDFSSGLQNGSPDGLALVDATGAVVEFLSYEGVVVAIDGPAAGLTSTDIGVSESSSTAAGQSLQRGGLGASASSFSWQAAQAETPGSANTGQVFDGGCGAGFSPYGCLSTAGSLTLLSGNPAVGSSFQLGVDNPLGTQMVGSFPVLLIAALPDPHFPCGTPLPGFGMGGPGALGELLLTLDGGNPTFLGAPWAGAGQPATFTLNIPDNCKLIGAVLYAQGALIDPVAAAGVGIALTEGAVLSLGP